MSKSSQIFNLSIDSENSRDSNNLIHEVSEKANSIINKSKLDSSDSKIQLSIKTEKLNLKINSSSFSLSNKLNQINENELNELKDTVKKLTEENKILREKIESLQNELELRDSKNNELIYHSVSSENIAYSDPLSHSLNPHQFKNFSQNDLSKIGESNSSDNLKLKKANSSQISKLKILRDKNKKKLNQQTNIINKNQYKKVFDEENKEKQKCKMFSYQAIKNFRKKFTIPDNITKSEIIKALINNNYDEKKASIILLRKNNKNE